MRAVSRRVIAAALVAAVCALSPASQLGLFGDDQGTQEQIAGVQYGQSVSVKPGELSGNVLFADGKTPAAEVSVRVWHVESGKFVAETITDDQGAYKLSELAEGRYFVIFGDRVNVDLHVDDAAELAGVPLNVIIPRGTAVFAQMAPEQRGAVLALLTQSGGAATIAGMPLRTVLIVAGGTVTAVGVVVAVENLGGHGSTGGIVSP